MNKETQNPPVITLEEFIAQGEGKWTQVWQDVDFRRALPKGVERIIVEDGRIKLSQEQRQRVFYSTFQSCFEEKKPSALTNLYINTNGDVMPKSLLSQLNTEPSARGELSALLALGFNLTDKEYVATTVYQVSQNLSHEKTTNLYDNIFRLLMNNSASRKWIKTHNLDGRSGVDWDEVVPNIGLFPYRGQRLPIQFREDLNLYVPKALEQFILYVIEYINNPPQITPHRKRMDVLSIEFIQRLKELKPEVRTNITKINPELLDQVETLLSKKPNLV